MRIKRRNDEKTEKQESVGRAGLEFLMGNYLVRGVTFLTMPIFARLLSTADFGIYNSYIAYESIMYIIISFVLHTSFKNARMKYGDSFPSYVSSCVLLLVINTIVFLVIGNAIEGIFSGAGHVFLTLLLLHSFASAMITYYQIYVSIRFRARSYVVLSACISIGQILLSILLILTVFSQNRAYGRIVGMFFPCFVAGVGLVILFWRVSSPRVSKEYWKYALSYSVPLIPHSLSQVILNAFDRIMISSMIGNSEAGIYSFAYTVNSFFLIAFSSIEQVWGPWFYEKMQAGARNEIKDVAAKYVISMGLFSSCVILISPEIIYIFGTKGYYDAVNLLLPILIGGFFSGLYKIVCTVEYYYEKTKSIAVGTMVAAVLNIILNYIYMRKYGYQAAAYTTLATYALYFAFHYMLAIRANKGRLFSFKSFAAAIALVSFSGIFMQVFVLNAVLRWGIGIILGVIMVAFLMKQFNIVEFARRKMKGQRNKEE